MSRTAITGRINTLRSKPTPFPSAYKLGKIVLLHCWRRCADSGRTLNHYGTGIPCSNPAAPKLFKDPGGSVTKKGSGQGLTGSNNWGMQCSQEQGMERAEAQQLPE